MTPVMGQPLDPATRPSRLRPLTHIAVVTLLSLSFLSGVVIWVGQSAQARTIETPAWLPGLLAFHGWLNPFQCALLGYLCRQHIRIGWQLKANLLTGFSMEFVFAGLILSGTGLYYAGSADWRSTFLWAHRVLGLLLPLSLGTHWIAGWRWAVSRSPKLKD